VSRVDLFLAPVLVGCALGVVHSQHLARSYFVELERLKKEAHALEEQWGKLQLEQGTWANPARVDLLARTQLGLIPPPQERIRVETLGEAP
jgi:cell division protein FtsL